MEVLALWKVLVRRWWVILIPTVVAALLSVSSLIAAFRPPVSYSLAIRFTASARPVGSGTYQDLAYTPWLASEYAVNSIAAWMRTESFAREVSTALTQANFSISVEALRAVIVSDSARSLMTLYVTAWPNPDELRAIGMAAAEVLKTRTESYFPQLAAEKAVIVPLDAVQPAPISVPLAQRFAPLARIAIGLALGVLLAFALEYFDYTIRDRTELERLGFQVLAEIPRYSPPQ
jgi:capsular polysaccharide biosynthesis protein